METIKKIYKVGYGPSSSHTMGPHRAAELFHGRTPEATRYRVTLYGSLAATGKGHHTDLAITRGLAPKEVEIVWRADIVKPFHPNGMFFEALDTDGGVTGSWLVYSIGGGNLATEEGEVPMDITPDGEVYPHNTMKDICEATDMSRGGLYSHFPGTKEIFEAIILRMTGNAADNMYSEMEKGVSAVRILNTIFEDANNLNGGK